MIARAYDARPSHTARDHCGMAGHAASGRQDAFGGVHAVDIFRARLDPHEDHALAARGARLGLLGGEHDLARGRTRRGR